MKRNGTTTITKDTLIDLLHPHIAFDANYAVEDDIEDGVVPVNSYIQSVAIIGFIEQVDGSLEVEWEALVIG